MSDNGNSTITGRPYQGPRTHGLNIQGTPGLTARLRAAFSREGQEQGQQTIQKEANRLAAGHPSAIAAAQDHIATQKARANAGPAFDQRRQTMGLNQPWGTVPLTAQTDHYGNPVGGSTGVAGHIADRAGLGVSGGGSVGSMMAQHQAADHVNGLLASSARANPLLPHQPSEPDPLIRAFGMDHPSMDQREANVRQQYARMASPKQQTGVLATAGNAGVGMFGPVGSSPSVAVPQPPQVAGITGGARPGLDRLATAPQDNRTPPPPPGGILAQVQKQSPVFQRRMAALVRPIVHAVATATNQAAQGAGGQLGGAPAADPYAKEEARIQAMFDRGDHASANQAWDRLIQTKIADKQAKLAEGEQAFKNRQFDAGQAAEGKRLALDQSRFAHEQKQDETITPAKVAGMKAGAARDEAEATQAKMMASLPVDARTRIQNGQGTPDDFAALKMAQDTALGVKPAIADPNSPEEIKKRFTARNALYSDHLKAAAGAGKIDPMEEVLNYQHQTGQNVLDDPHSQTAEDLRATLKSMTSRDDWNSAVDPGLLSQLGSQLGAAYRQFIPSLNPFSTMSGQGRIQNDPQYKLQQQVAAFLADRGHPQVAPPGSPPQVAKVNPQGKAAIRQTPFASLLNSLGFSG